MHPRTQSTTRRLAAVTLGGALAVTLAAAVPAAAKPHHDAVVVANRGSGDVSVIDARTLGVTTLDLPGDAEPMYVSHDSRHDRVLVGDRASSTVVALDEDTFEVVGTVEVGDGVFHQWYDAGRDQLWVVGDTSGTVSVVDGGDLAVLATVDLPADLADRGGRPHDVFVAGRYAFVSVVGLDDGSGVVLRYSTRTFAETGRIDTTGDPHLFVRGAVLYVASQEGSSVTAYRTDSLRELRSADVPAAHGIWVTGRGEVLATNIAGGGTDAVWNLGTRLQGSATADTAVPTPHNLVETRGQVFVTHSGATANQVSVIDRTRHGFGTVAQVTVGTNPFGLAVIQR